MGESSASKIGGSVGSVIGCILCGCYAYWKCRRCKNRIEAKEPVLKIPKFNVEYRLDTPRTPKNEYDIIEAVEYNLKKNFEAEKR